MQVTATTAAATVFSSTGVARVYLFHLLIAALCCHLEVDLIEGSHRSTATTDSDPSRAELRDAVVGIEELLSAIAAATAVTSLLDSF